MAHKKAGGSTRNGRDSNPKYLGVKRFGGENVEALGAGSRDAGLYSGSVVICSTSQEAIKVVSELVQKEDLVFVKG